MSTHKLKKEDNKCFKILYFYVCLYFIFTFVYQMLN